MDFGSSAGTSPVARLRCGHLHLADLASPVINVGITQPPVSGTVWGGDTDLYRTRKAAIRFEASEHKLTDQICTTRRHAQNVLGQSKQLTGANLERTRPRNGKLKTCTEQQDNTRISQAKPEPRAIASAPRGPTDNDPDF